MALSGTMSNPSDWLQFYNNSISSQALGGHVSSSAVFGHHDQTVVSHHESTVVTATATATASTAAAGAGQNPSSSNNNTNSQLSPEGRVTKPVRKRSRASRRTPTTLLNTDTANFRAMVQQFTGGPSTASFTQQQPANFGFGLGARQQGFMNPNGSSLMVPPPPDGGYNPLQLQQQNSYLLSLNNNNNNNNNNNSDNNQYGFVQRLMSSTARPSNNIGVSSFSSNSDEFSSQVQAGQQQPGLVGSGRPNSNPSNENRGGNSFLY